MYRNATRPDRCWCPASGGRNLSSFYEPASVGSPRFMLFIAPEPFPLAVTQPATAGKSLDWLALSKLARHFAAQPKHLRELHVLPVTMTRN